MFSKILEFVKSWSEKGLDLPFFRAVIDNKISITLWFAYISFIIMIASLIGLHFKPNFLIPTTITIVVWVIATIFYLIRRIHKAKLDFNNKSLELESPSNNNSNS
jgi:hypothetical protein